MSAYIPHHPRNERQFSVFSFSLSLQVLTSSSLPFVDPFSPSPYISSFSFEISFLFLFMPLLSFSRFLLFATFCQSYFPVSVISLSFNFFFFTFLLFLSVLFSFYLFLFSPIFPLYLFSPLFCFLLFRLCLSPRISFFSFHRYLA